MANFVTIGLQGPPGPPGQPGTVPLSAANVAALPGVDPLGLFASGAPVFVQTLRSFFVLDRTSVATPDNIVYVSANGGGNWIRIGTSDPIWQTQPAWYLNAGTGNDENSGADAGHPIKTPEELVRRLGFTHTGRVRLLPLAGGVDQGPRYAQVATILSYYAPITFGPGTWNFLSDVQTPNGTDVEGSGEYGTLIAQPTAGSTLVQAAFQAFAVVGSTVTLAADVPIDAISVSLTTSIPAGSFLALQTPTGQTGSHYVTGTPSGGGPYTIPLDRPTCYAFPAAGSTARVLTTRPQDVRISKLRFSGPQGNGYIHISSWGYNWIAEDCLADGSLGVGASMIAFLWDTGSISCGFERMRSTAPVKFAFYFAQTEGCWASECDASGTIGGAGLQLEDGINTRLIGCRARGNLSSGSFGCHLTSSGAALTGTFGAIIVGCDFGGSYYGLYFDSGSHNNTVSATNCNECTSDGIVVDSVTAACSSLTMNGVTAKACVNSGMIVSTGSTGIIVNGVDVSGSSPGISNAGDLWISGLVGKGMPANSATIIASGGNTYVRNLVGQSPTANWVSVIASGSAYVSIDGAHLTLDATTGFPIGIQTQGTSRVEVERLLVDGVQAASRVTGISPIESGAVIRMGREMRIDGLAASISNGVSADVGLMQTGGTLKVSTTGGTTSLTWAQAQNNTIEVTGVLASDATINLPAQQSALGVPGLEYTLVNGTSGAHNVTLSVTGGSGIQVVQGKTAWLRVNSAGNVVRVTADT